MQTLGHTIKTSIAQWKAWDGAAPENINGKPDVGFIEPMLRRRLSPLARAALHTAHACAGDLPSVRFVYASRHGELDRTLELLQALAQNEDLSPTTFGLSVLNANAGLYAIARQDHAPATAIAAGPETFAFGLIEATARAENEPGSPVLYVYADAPAPAPFGPLSDDPANILAIALLIDPARATQQLITEYISQEGEADPQSQAAVFLAGANSQKNVTWIGTQRRWQWRWQ